MWNDFSMNTDYAEREKSREQNTHKLKLQTIKSRIDNKPPRSHSHIKLNHKKKLQAKQRQDQIQKDNKNLLQKLMTIESKPLLLDSRPTLRNSRNLDAYTRVALQNSEILQRIQSAKSYYSNQKFKRDYEFQQYLKTKLSENARRVPKASVNHSTEISRPSTAK